MGSLGTSGFRSLGRAIAAVRPDILAIEPPSAEVGVTWPAIEGFLLDDENLDEFAGHGVRDDQVLQVLEDQFYMGRNKRGRRGSHLVIGYDYSGECLTIPVRRTMEPGLWRPVTAWLSTPEERRRRDQARRQ